MTLTIPSFRLSSQSVEAYLQARGFEIEGEIHSSDIVALRPDQLRLSSASLNGRLPLNSFCKPPETCRLSALTRDLPRAGRSAAQPKRTVMAL
jgi:hypothetical protein